MVNINGRINAEPSVGCDQSFRIRTGLTKTAKKKAPAKNRERP